MKKNIIFLIILVMFFTVSCTKYERQTSPFKMPEAYSNVKEIGETKVAAFAYHNPEDAKKAFGFNINAAEILPVQVVFDNKGQNVYEIVSAQTFLVDKEDNIWPIMDKNLVYERIASKTEVAKIGSEAARWGVLGGIGGAVIGAAIGIVTGESVAESAGKGAAVGAAAGITAGGAHALTSGNAERKISEDLRNKSIESKVIPAKSITYGFIFFPGEAKLGKELRLQIKDVKSGEIHSLSFVF